MKKVLFLSIDAKLFEEGSAVAERFVEYGKLFLECNVIVYTKPGFKEKKLAPNVKIYPTNSRWKWLYFFDALRIAKKIITRDTIVSSQEAITNIVGIQLKKKYGIGLQVQVHTDVMNPLFRKESFKNWLRFKLYTWTLPQADYVRVVSKRILNSVRHLITCAPSRIAVLPLFIDKERLVSEPITLDLHTKYPEFSFIVLMASRFEVEKNIVMALHAFKEVVRLHPETGLVLVGNGSQLSLIKRYIEQLELRTNVRIEGWTSSLASYYKTSNAFLVSSTYEGYGVTLVEAALLGVPIVTTDVGIVGEVFKNSEDVLVCKAISKEGLMLPMLQLIQNNALRHTLTINARHTAEQSVMDKATYFAAYQAMFN